MKLFNKAIDNKLFKQYQLGSDLSKQEVVAKIFNPTGAGNWFLVNSDPNDPDYLWAIVDLGYGAEVGSVSRKDLENYRGRFGLGLERDLGFDPMNAEELYKGLRRGEYYADGGNLRQSLEELLKQDVVFLKFDSGRAYDTFSRLDIPFVNVHDYDFNHYCIIETKNLEKVLDNVRKGVRVVKKKFSSDDLGFDYKGRTSFADGGDITNFSDNQRMIMNQNVELEHHHEELEDILEDEVPVPAWVVAKIATATQSVSDVTHYLDGQKEIMEEQFEEEDEDEEEDEEIKNKKVVEPIFVDSKAKKEITKNFTEDALGNLRGFLKGMEDIYLREDYTFDYKNEQYEVEPIINSDEKGVSNAVFTIFNGDGEEVGEVTYSREGGKQKFTANSDLFSWNNAKFEDGGYFDGTIPNVSTYMSTYAKGGETQKLEVGKKYRAKNGDILTIKDFDIENHITIDDGKGKLSSIGIQRISVFKDLINDGELVPLNELGNFVNDVYAKGGGIDVEKVNKADEIYREHNRERKEKGIENFSKESVALWNEKYNDRLEKLKLTFEEKNALNPKKWYADGGFMNDVYAKGGNLKKYILKADIKTVTLKRNGKELTYKGADVLNGANVLAKGGDISSKANYVPKRDVVEVELKDGSKVKPANGYWVKKDAEPIGAEPTPTSSGKSEPKIGETYIRKGVTGWKATTSVDNFDGHDWRISTFKSSRGDLITSAQGGKTEKSGSGGAEMFSFMLYQDPHHTLEVSKPSRLTEKVIAEQHAKGLAKFKKFMETGMFKGGGRISNFDKLSAKVAKQYEGKPVKNKYQEEYGKFYSKEEAKEVGDKVAGKVKALQSKKMMKGGATFAEKSKAIAKNFEGKKVEPKYQKEYGKVYDKQEAKEVGNKIAGSIVKKSQNGSELLKKANILAKQIRKDGESWNDAKRRAFTQLKK